MLQTLRQRLPQYLPIQKLQHLSNPGPVAIDDDFDWRSACERRCSIAPTQPRGFFANGPQRRFDHGEIGRNATCVCRVESLNRGRFPEPPIFPA